MNDNETITEIIAEKRRLAAEMEKALGDQHSSVEMLKDDADRLEAAHRRELSKICPKTGGDFGQLGDAAKLREALEMVRDAHYTKEVGGELYEGFEVEADDGTGRPLICIVENALSAPPRNCDKYATADEALKAQEQMFNDSNFANGECKLGCPECDNPRVGCKIAWLFAPATEKEGGAR